MLNNIGSKGKVMIIDDSKFSLFLLKEMLEKACYEVRPFLSGKLAIRAAEKNPPDIILLDITMPEMDGYQVCQLLKSNYLLKDIPVIFLSSNTEAFDKIKAFEVGGADYISKPFDFEELNARVGLQLRLRQYQIELEEKNIELQKTLRQLEDAVKKLEEMAVTDFLTQLSNRRGIIEILKKETARSKRWKKDLSLIIGDIDHFKQINDTYGHECGDFVLEKIAVLLKSSVRSGDHVARWGGEEFLLVLVETGCSGAMVLAEKIRSKIESITFTYQENPISVSMTFGVTEFNPNLGIFENVANADQALYEGKKSGRNRVVGSGFTNT
ncbi:MAG: diguanylate cyclase [Dehalobacterium sp.]